MRNRSIRGLYVLAASVAVSSALGLAGATAASATTHVRPHATTVCDNNPGTVSPRCTNISNLMLNQDNGPVFIQNATEKGVKAPSLYQDRIVNLRQASNTRTNEDFIIRQVGILQPAVRHWRRNSIDPTSYACLNYPPTSTRCTRVSSLRTPTSPASALARVARPRASRFALSAVAPRGRSGSATWPLPSRSPCRASSPFILVYFPLEFSADTSASNPLVMTLNPNSSNPKNLLTLQQENFSGGTCRTGRCSP